MSFATYKFPLRKEAGQNWCSLASMGIRRIDIVAYKIEKKDNHGFSGGHRHSYAVIREDIHLLLPPEHEYELDIGDVTPSAPPRRKHDKRR